MLPFLRLRAWQVAAISMLAILAWWTLAARYVYEGHWNALYCTGYAVRMPEWLTSHEPLWFCPGPGGYDGQYFHLLAHRPLELRQLAPWLDAPRLRVQRILLPLSAWLLAFGRFEWVDPAYFFLMLVWLGAGVWWTARLAELRRDSPLWGFSFLLLPSTLSSIDRMLADGPLTAAVAGFLYGIETGRWRAAWTLAVLAPFLRETGILLPAAAGAVFLWRRRWLTAAAWMAAAAPFLLWIHSLRDLPGSLSMKWAGWFHSITQIILFPDPYENVPRLRHVLHAMDLISLAGFVLALACALVLLWRRRREAENPRAFAWMSGALFAAAALTLVHLEPRHAWDNFYSYGRVFSPVFLILLLDGLERRRAALPLALTLPTTARVSLYFASPALRILRALTGL